MKLNKHVMMILLFIMVFITACSSEPVTTQTNSAPQIPAAESNITKNENLIKEDQNDSTDNELGSSTLESTVEIDEATDTTLNKLPPSGTLKVHYIDVGQGDATLLQGPDFTILIDAGRHDQEDVVPYLQLIGIEKIDVMIGTHPHSDHIGQMVQVLETFPVDEVWMSGDEHTSLVFERTLDAILASDASYTEPQKSEEYQIGSANIVILHPDELTGDLNGGSISMRIQFSNIAFVFTGDTEHLEESKMIQSGMDLQAQIFQAGHHGSSTSNTRPFLEKVQPEIVIYSAGFGNTYGHPHQEVMERFKAMNIQVYGTDIDGTVIVTTDGSTYSVTTTGAGELVIPQQETSDPENISDPEIQESPSSVCAPGQVDINTAELEQLQQIHQIGSDRAQQIMELREQRKFSSIEEITRITGIGDARMKEIIAEGIACVG